MAKSLSTLLLGKQIDAIYHTSIVFNNKEWFYGGDGITHCVPATTMLGQPLRQEFLGVSEITEEIMLDYIQSMAAGEFAGKRYKLFEHNCNNFSNALSQFLLGKDIPKEITGLPQEVLSTPFGMQIKAMLENMDVNAMGNNKQNSTSYG